MIARKEIPAQSIVQAVLGATLICSNSIDAKLHEDNLLVQYMRVHDDGKGVLIRQYHKVNEDLTVTRCRAEYDVISSEQRNGYVQIIFDKGRFYNDDGKRVLQGHK